MRKLLIYLSVLALCGSALAPQKPMLGELPDASQFPMPVYMGLFNEGAGTLVNDSSGNRNTGIIANGVWKPGKFGRCVSFDGTDTIIDLGNDISKIIGKAGDFTFSAWVNVSGFPENNAGWIIGVNVENVIHLRWRRAGDGEYFDCFVDYATSDALSKSHDIGDAAVTGVWTHIVAVLDEATKTISFFINGIEESSYIEQTAGVGARIDRSAESTFIGDSRTGGYAFNGLIDLPIIFDRALSASQIAQLYIDPFPWFVEDPIELWEAAIAAPPTGGQVIFINLSSVGCGFGGFGLILLPAIIKKLRNRKQVK